MMKQVYTMEDLVSRERLDAGADKPARLAVLGWPIAHSASPGMHQAALDSDGLAMRYIRLEIEPGGIAECFRRLRDLGFVGCNVTVPHKFDAMAACDEVHPDAVALGAVNTVRFDPDATRGFNTDGPGFANAVEEVFGEKLGSFRVLIVGAGGGAGQAIATQCVLSGVARLVLVNRTLKTIEDLAGRLKAIRPEVEISAVSLDDSGLCRLSRECGLVVNTSSVGLKPGDPPVLGADCLNAGQRVYDTIYQPAVTPLLALAAESGCRTGNGFSMLLQQGALAYQHWFPGTDPLPRMRASFVSR